MNEFKFTCIAITPWLAVTCRRPIKFFAYAMIIALALWAFTNLHFASRTGITFITNTCWIFTIMIFLAYAMLSTWYVSSRQAATNKYSFLIASIFATTFTVVSRFTIANFFYQVFCWIFCAYL